MDFLILVWKKIQICMGNFPYIYEKFFNRDLSY